MHAPSTVNKEQTERVRGDAQSKIKNKRRASDTQFTNKTHKNIRKNKLRRNYHKFEGLIFYNPDQQEYL